MTAKINDLIIRCNVYGYNKVINHALKYRQPIPEYICNTLLFAKNNDIYQNSSSTRENEKIYHEVLRRTYRYFIDCKGISSGLKRRIKLLDDYPRLYRILIVFKKIIYRY